MPPSGTADRLPAPHLIRDSHDRPFSSRRQRYRCAQRSRRLVDAVHGRTASFKQRPRMIARAKDMHYYTPDGREVLDGAAGLWCCNAGHNRDADRRGDPEAGGRARLFARLPVRPPEGVRARVPHRRSSRRAISITCSSAIRVRRRSTPRSRSRSPIGTSRGQGQRTRLIGRERGYHGVGFGGISVGGIVDEPQVLRHAARRRRSPAAHLQPRRAGLLARASRNGARISPTISSASSRCTTPRPSPP